MIDMDLIVTDRLEPDARSLTSRIYQELRKEILQCKLPPGEKLRISTIKDRFDSSLSSVREAMTRLAAEGWLVSRDQRGFTVAGVSRDDLVDLFRTRAQIECLALGQALSFADKHWEADVSMAYGDLVRNQGASENYWLAEHWVSSHDRFHKALISGCKSPALIAIVEQLSIRSQRYRHLSTTLPSHRDGSAEHRALFESVLARDCDRAQTILSSHYEMTAQILADGSSVLINGG
ncbi:GntR family transcriptional regulator [Sphingobium sp. MK2]|uniref:GntR family transcriptional regulator n=1 Tax=Sphingobium sp. MK2 TaxID=3116540 RepID=UPI0032E3607A